MHEDRLEILHQENNLNICIDFLVRMIEKYGPEMDICNTKDEAFEEAYGLKKDGHSLHLF